MSKKPVNFLTALYIYEQRVSLGRERIRAENRAKVAEINAQASMYCADVGERVSRDTCATMRYAANAGQSVAMARMASEIIRGRSDVLVQASRERCEQFRALTAHTRAATQRLAAGGMNPEQKATLENELNECRRLQVELLAVAQSEARQYALPPGSLTALPPTGGCHS